MIPIGLLPMSQGQVTPGLLGQGYWLGNQYIMPQYQYTPPVPGLPTSTTPPPAVVTAADQAKLPPDPGAMFGSGAQGEMGGGFAPGIGPTAPTAPSVAGLSPIDPRDLPSLPGMPNEAPSAPQAPATGLAQTTEANQNENAGKAGKTGIAAGMPGVPGTPATATPTVSEMKEMADKARADLAAIGKDVFGRGTVMGDEQDAGMTAEAQAAAQGVDTSNDRGKTPAESGPGPGATNAGSGVSTDQNSDEGGVGYRKGGRVSSNMDGHLQPVKGILHEGEFVMNPEMTAMMDKMAPGLLNRIARKQKRMVGKMGMLG